LLTKTRKAEFLFILKMQKSRLPKEKSLASTACVSYTLLYRDVIL
jgi:hypothetical protein